MTKLSYTGNNAGPSRTALKSALDAVKSETRLFVVNSTTTATNVAAGTLLAISGHYLPVPFLAAAAVINGGLARVRAANIRKISSDIAALNL